MKVKLSARTFRQNGQFVGEIVYKELVVKKVSGPTFTHASRLLRSGGLIPTDIVVPKNDVVEYTIFRKDKMSEVELVRYLQTS